MAAGDDVADAGGGARRRKRTRRKKTAAQRRAQKKRAGARTIQCLLQAFAEVSAHRGGERTRLAIALESALKANTVSTGIWEPLEVQVQPRTGDATPDATGLVGSATEAATPTINANIEEPPAKTDGSPRVAPRHRMSQSGDPVHGTKKDRAPSRRGTRPHPPVAGHANVDAMASARVVDGDGESTDSNAEPVEVPPREEDTLPMELVRAERLLAELAEVHGLLRQAVSVTAQLGEAQSKIDLMTAQMASTEHELADVSRTFDVIMDCEWTATSFDCLLRLREHMRAQVARMASSRLAADAPERRPAGRASSQD